MKARIIQIEVNSWHQHQNRLVKTPQQQIQDSFVARSADRFLIRKMNFANTRNLPIIMITPTNKNWIRPQGKACQVIPVDMTSSMAHGIRMRKETNQP